jgi:hypothetical protein
MKSLGVVPIGKAPNGDDGRLPHSSRPVSAQYVTIAVADLAAALTTFSQLATATN